MEAANRDDDLVTAGYTRQSALLYMQLSQHVGLQAVHVYPYRSNAAFPASPSFLQTDYALLYKLTADRAKLCKRAGSARLNLRYV
jgi:hypothetical protein